MSAPHRTPAKQDLLDRPSEGRSVGRIVFACVAVLVLACLFPLPAAAAPPGITLEASPSTVRIPDSFQLIARTDRDIGPTPYFTRIYDDDSGQMIAQCSSGSTCTSGGTASWDDNADPQPRHFHAETWSASAGGSRSQDVTVTVQPADLAVSLAAEPAEVTEPDSFAVIATANRDVGPTPYFIQIIDTETDAVVQSCAGGTTCSSGGSGWNPGTRSFLARLRSGSGHVAASSDEQTVVVDRLLFSVDLTFSQTGNGDYTATATTNRDVAPTPYYLRVKDSDGVITQCSGGTTCGTGALETGETYRGTVETFDGQVLVGDSGAWTLTEDGPESETVDDLDLVSLAAAFPSMTALCDAVLTAPAKTYVMGYTASDQDIVCNEAQQAGKSVRVALRLIAAAGGGTTILWYLAEDLARENTPPDPSDDDPPQEPRPVPPILHWPDNLEEEVDQLIANNSDRLADRLPEPEIRPAARVVLKQCKLLVNKAVGLVDNLDEDDCLELPIFASGDSDVPEPTNHDRQSIGVRPQWALLQYRSRATKVAEGFNPKWYVGSGRCASINAGQQCHEYPFFATKEGGKREGETHLAPRLEPVNSTQNQTQGSKYGGFTVSCLGSVDGTRFLSIPVPEGSGIPTLPLCNNG